MGRWYANMDPFLGGLYVEPGEAATNVVFVDEGKLWWSSKTDYDYEAKKYKFSGCVFPVILEKGLLLGQTAGAAQK